ncbi:MAG: hypothetical protein ABJD53_17580 [Gammaproteobacteria bacterium]
MDRRTFCLGSAAAAVCCHAEGVFAATGTGATGAATASRSPAIALDEIVFDSRYAECRSFAAAARRSGHQTIAFEGDVTPLWHDMLRPLWAAGRGSVAGMTTPSSLFCLEQMAKDHWRHVVIRIDHRRSLIGFSHRVTATEPMLSRTFAALNRRQDWPERVMELLGSCERAKDRPCSSGPVSDDLLDPSVASGADLVSWVISA